MSGCRFFVLGYRKSNVSNVRNEFETNLRIVRRNTALTAKLLEILVAIGAFAARINHTAHTNAIADLSEWL